MRDKSFYQKHDVDEQKENRWTETSGYEEKHKSKCSTDVVGTPNLTPDPELSFPV